MKIKHIIALFIVVCITALVAGCAPVPEDVAKAEISTMTQTQTTMTGEPVAIDTSKSTFLFTGYGPGKIHNGTFTDYSGELLVDNNVIVGAKGTIQSESITSDGGDGLDGHLKNDDFLNIDVFPDITYESSSITEVNGTLMMTGSFTLLGVTQQITFPVTRDESTLSADFLLDITPYGIKYLGIDSHVRVMFTMSR